MIYIILIALIIILITYKFIVTTLGIMPLLVVAIVSFFVGFTLARFR